MSSEQPRESGADSIRTIAVVGSGYMGGGIAQVLALSGRDVVLSDVDAAKAEAARVRLLDEARRFVDTDLFDPGSVEILEQRLRAADSIESAVADVDYVTEAVLEDRKVKADALRRISLAARTDTVIGTNTSAIPIGELAESVDRPERFLGVHWMNPAPFVPAIELIPTSRTSDDARLGKPRPGSPTALASSRTGSSSRCTRKPCGSWTRDWPPRRRSTPS
jgi:3-hydroxybutyryl-CoA dehydrogenase